MNIYKSQTRNDLENFFQKTKYIEFKKKSFQFYVYRLKSKLQWGYKLDYLPNTKFVFSLLPRRENYKKMKKYELIKLMIKMDYFSNVNKPG